MISSFIDFFLKHTEFGGHMWEFFATIKRFSDRSAGLHNKLLKRNLELKQIHVGERCFVLGNGPSLKNEDLSLIRNEVVFTVNNIMDIDQWGKFKSSYHVIIDLALFGLVSWVKNVDQNEVRRYTEQLKDMINDTVLILPLNGYEYFKNNGLDSNTYYFTVCEPSLKIKSINPSKYVFSVATVVQIAIQYAIYMGFKEIYLLGCDCTESEYIINMVLNHNNHVDYHAYNEKYEITNNILEQQLKRDKISAVFNSQYKLFLGYERLAEYCTAHDIVLKNLSNRTLLDSVERDSLENILV